MPMEPSEVAVELSEAISEGTQERNAHPRSRRAQIQVPSRPNIGTNALETESANLARSQRTKWRRRVT